MTRTFRAPFVALMLAFAMMVSMAGPATAEAHGILLEDVTGTFFDENTGEDGEFTGDLSITEITRDGDQLNFVGSLVGETDTGREIDETFDTTGDLTREGPGNSCRILFLDLGPIFLDLLGLQVDLSQVELDVRAVPGAGNLLGNLLCAVAGLLDGPGLGGGIGNAIDNLLDRVNDILDGLLG